MKKITMLVPEKNKRDFLRRLKQYRLMHLKYLKPPSSSEIAEIEEKQNTIREAVTILSRRSCDTAKKDAARADEGELYEKAGKIILCQREIEYIEKSMAEAKNKMLWYEPTGPFAPGELFNLQSRGIIVKLYCLNNIEFKTIRDKKNIYVVGKKSGYTYTAALFYGEEKGFPFKEITLPKESYETLEAEMEMYGEERGEKEKFIVKHLMYMRQMEDCIKKLEERHEFTKAFFGMKEEGGISVIRGFCPVDSADKIISLAGETGTGYVIEAPDDPEETPTLVKNPGWVNTIRPVFKFINTIPGYGEFDISIVFLIFFTIFFAILIGDAGYGLVLIGLTYMLKRKIKTLPKEVFRLLFLLSSSTAAWGVITGAWFGMERISKLPFINILVIQKISTFSEQSGTYVMLLCFIIGSVQLSIAHLMRFVREINSLRAVSQIGWIFTIWGLFFAANTMVIKNPFPRFALYMLMAGIPIILIFSNPRKNIFKGIIKSLMEIPLTIISSFSDIVSYIRLFAVGYATAALAIAFNSMVMDIGFGGFFAGLASALILFLGHGLNIILGLIAVVVHGIRLNMLEFSGHLGMAWSGREYKPFGGEI